MTKKAVAAVGDAVRRVRENLDEIRAEVAQLRDEAELEAARPVPAEEVARRVDETIDRLRGSVGRTAALGGLIVRDGGHAAEELSRQAMSGFAAVALAAPDVLRA